MANDGDGLPGLASFFDRITAAAGFLARAAASAAEVVTDPALRR